MLDVRFERKFASDVIERIKQALLERQIITLDMVMSALYTESGARGDTNKEAMKAVISMDEKL